MEHRQSSKPRERTGKCLYPRFRRRHIEDAEPPTGHADIDNLSRVGLRDILFNYTGRVDMSLYRKIGVPMAMLQTDEFGNMQHPDIVDPMNSPAVQEFDRDTESRMDDYDHLRDYTIEMRNGQTHDQEPSVDQPGRNNADLDGADAVPPASDPGATS